MIEEWRDIPGYEKMYQVSNLGRIKSLERFAEYKDGRKKKIEEKILVQAESSYGYRVVSLYKGRKRKMPYVHILVANAFIPNPDEKPQVNHKNSLRYDNRKDNLEFCTHQENATHRSTKNINTKIICNETGEIFASQKEASERYNLNRSKISLVLNGKRKTTGGYTFSHII